MGEDRKTADMLACKGGSFMPEDPEDKCCNAHQGISRRGFLSSVSVGAVAAVSLGNAPIAPAQEIEATGQAVTINLRINGFTRRILIEPRWSLLYVVRDLLGLTGTKIGCDRGECGACTVLINGKPRYACMTLAIEAQGFEITTLEGLMDGEKLGVVQQAFAEEDAFQCGFCTPGQIVAAEGLLRQNPNPDIDQIRVGMSGNLCRCAAYQHIFKAVGRAASLRAKGGAQ
jgi:xanthine dehydrogenase YagT iron-sulfur-binding subunit